MLMLCGRCGTAFAVGLPYCPQCTSTDCRPQGEEDQVAKITQHGGPSNAAEELDQLDQVLDEANAEEEGGEQPSPGSSSPASSEKAPTSDEPSSPSPRKPAQTTGSRSSKGRAGSASATSTAGSGPETTRPTS